jgi:hypothetical protein
VVVAVGGDAKNTLTRTRPIAICSAYGVCPGGISHDIRKFSSIKGGFLPKTANSAAIHSMPVMPRPSRPICSVTFRSAPRGPAVATVNLFVCIDLRRALGAIRTLARLVV